MVCRLLRPTRSYSVYISTFVSQTNRKQDLMTIIRSSVVSLASRISLSYLHNWGRFLGISLVVQIITGIILTTYYTSYLGYERVMYIVSESGYGWLWKIIHSNNAGLIFVLLYLHLYKNIKLASYRLHAVWISGLIMWILIMAAGFTGYVLVGSQIRFWAAIVITRLIRVIPFYGETLIYFVWGGFNISWITLQLLFLLHFLIPFLVLGVIVLHLIFLHKTGSTNMLYITSGINKVTFFPFYWVKDLINLAWYLLFIVFVLLYPYTLGEVELFEEANPLVSPAHVVPEFYFLAAYAVLRRVPSKGLGVLIMFARIGVYFMYPLTIGYVTPASGINHTGVWLELLAIQVGLSYLGIRPISQPFVLLSLICVLWFFRMHAFLMGINLLRGWIFGSFEEEPSIEKLGKPFTKSYLRIIQNSPGVEKYSWIKWLE